VTRAAADAPFIFADDDFAWDDSTFGDPQTAAAARPTPLRPRRRPSRTLKRDLQGLRRWASDRTAPVPLPLLLAGVGCLVAVLLGLFVLGRGGDPETSPQSQQPSAATPPATAATEAPLGGVTSLAPGDRGPMVRGVQAALAALGSFAYVPDGDFGEVTASAVASFQQERALSPDGVVGQETAEALRGALAERLQEQSSTAAAGLTAAVDAGRLPTAAVERYRATLDRSLDDVERLTLASSGWLALALQTVAGHASEYDRPRALTLFGMLAAVRRHVAANPPAADPDDLVGPDGVVYRFFPSHGFQFHPLASFVHLNGLAKDARPQQVRRLTDALLARAVPVGKALTWEYYFPFGGPPRWTSGLAQAVAAQALARAGALLEDPRLSAMARTAYRAIPAGLSRPLGDGVWIREYGFSDTAILNAQLQSLVSLSEYVEITGHDGPRALTDGLATAAKTLLPQFDTGCWSLYALGGNNASPTYHAYHVRLLDVLADKTGDPVWRDTATRWDGYQKTGGACA
jgi:D-glucuronyl C5-epimerase C-terminus/Putative peptidoglycan binding domain